MSDATLESPSRESLVRRVFGRTQHFDFIGKSRIYLIIVLSSLVVVAAGTALRGINFSLEFTGGTGLTVTEATKPFTAEQLQDAVSAAGVEDAIVQVIEDGSGALISTPAVDEIGGELQRDVIAAIAETTGVDEEDIAVEAVGPRWGQQITRQSLRGLLIFLVLVSLYLAFRFEWRMAAAAILTLVHDIALTIGIYAIVGFPVSPASVIAFLTILGYSLYDTVVVFDRVTEDTASLSSVSTKTYGDAANDALNEVLVRSLSTAITSMLPVASLLFVGATLLGAETLQDLALALFVGMGIGVYSSIVIAAPFLVWLKEKEPKWRELKERVESRRGARDAAGTPAVATAGSAGGASAGGGSAGGGSAGGRSAPKSAPPPSKRTGGKKSRAQRKR